MSAILLLTSAVSAAAVTPQTPLRYTVETAINRSTREPTGRERRSIVLQPDMPTRDGAALTARQLISDPHGHEETAYRIDRATLRFSATTITKRDDIGEEHVIALTGRCAHKVR